MSITLFKIFPKTCERLPGTIAQHDISIEAFLEQVSNFAASLPKYGFIADLARVEWAVYQARYEAEVPSHSTSERVEINPGLQVIEVNWTQLLPLIDGHQATPSPTSQILLFWTSPKNGETYHSTASPDDLLALKIISEELDHHDVASQGPHPVGVIDTIVDKAIRKGLLLTPKSRLRRSAAFSSIGKEGSSLYSTTDVFTLQWHITQSCDLSCRHCYDRSDRNNVSYDRGLVILDQMRTFCLNNHVTGQVSFSGGNPFLHPDFNRLYRAAHERNLGLAILGNPVSESMLNEVLAIAKPGFFQVSLEGLEEHNDYIRGKGNFQAVLEFLDLLKDKKIYSMVMLTLTRENLDQVLPLAEALRDRVDLFTFNRLAMVGEGANLNSPPAEEYRPFIREYLDTRKENPAMGLKDSLFNIQLEEAGANMFGGCTGYGCGAAFNFVSLLSDGQVHACRKFPSPIGDINTHSLQEIYDTSKAQVYRQGCRECDTCHLKPNCGGCLAVTYGYGLDPLKVKDPCCFME